MNKEKISENYTSAEMLAELLVRNLHESKLNVSYIEELLDETLEIIKGRTLMRNEGFENVVDYKNYII